MKEQKVSFKIIIPVLSVMLALVVGGILILAIGKNPIEAYGYLLKGAFGSFGSFGETIVKAVPLIFTGLAATFAYRSGVFNLGAEGQFIMGAIASIWFSTTFSGLPGALNIIISLILGAVFGGLWGIIPGLLKAYRGINEMIVSILLNYVATYFMGYLYSGPMMEKNIPQTAAIAAEARLPKILAGTRVHAGFLLAIIVAALLFYLLFYTSKGFKVRAVGLNQTAAKVNGYSVNKIIIVAFLMSGAIAGLGGSAELHGAQYRLMPGFGQGYGFDGVAIALIGQLNPIGTTIAAYLFAVLRAGANSMQVAAGIPTEVVDIIQALVIIFVVAATAFMNFPSVTTFMQNLFKKEEKAC